MTSSSVSAAHQLVGHTLPGGWTVVDRVEPRADATGGMFSVSYIVQSESGTRAFLKALDYSRAFQSSNAAELLQAMTTAFNFEVAVLERCGRTGMSRVVRALDHGQVTLSGTEGVQTVSYLIFELADGDVRGAMDATADWDDAWALRVVHHVATGLGQLHREGIAHQDVKPSNILTFGRDSKLGDLGRAAFQELAAPHDGQPVAGAYPYAPPELLYGHVDPDWNKRRQACDLYHLGGLIMFMFARVTATAALMERLRPEHRPVVARGTWTGGYPDVLPYVRDAFDAVVDDFATVRADRVGSELMIRVRQLCEPDPELRGHPRNRAFKYGSRYSLERYVSEFNLLARRAEIGYFRSAAA